MDDLIRSYKFKDPFPALESSWLNTYNSFNKNTKDTPKIHILSIANTFIRYVLVYTRYGDFYHYIFIFKILNCLTV